MSTATLQDYLHIPSAFEVLVETIDVHLDQDLKHEDAQEVPLCFINLDDDQKRIDHDHKVKEEAEVSERMTHQRKYEKTFVVN